MSYHVFFSFSQGLAKPLQCPKGTLASIHSRIRGTEQALGFEPGKDGWHWRKRRDAIAALKDDEVLCRAAEQHNGWIRDWLYPKFGEWSKHPVTDGETITLEQAQEFWHAIECFIHPEPERWTGDYYRARMDAIYEALRGRNGDGAILDACYGERPLTARQAAAVIRLFSEYLDPKDLRLDVPMGHDYLASSDDGGYTWCGKHGPIAEEDLGDHKRKRCELAAELRAEDKL